MIRIKQIAGRIIFPVFIMKCLFSCFLFIYSFNSVFSQTIIGFREPSNIQSILEYRIPPWGYSSLLLNFDFYGSGNDAKYQNDSNNKRFNWNIYIRPTFRKYYESEEKQSFFHTYLKALYNGYKSEWNYVNHQNINSRHDYNISFVFNFDQKRYFTTKQFFSVESDGEIFYYNQHPYTSTETSYETIRGYNITAKIGFGSGRLRDITPVIRALRLSERYNALGKKSSLSKKDIQMIAEAIAKQSGYNIVYERSDKYFWNNLFGKIENIPTLSPFEVYYLSEVLCENIGVRQQGWNILSGLKIFNRCCSNKKKINLGVFAHCIWYKNLTLDHQIGFEGSGYYGMVFGDNYNKEPNSQLQLKVEYLWIISDRLLWESNLDAIEYFGKIEGLSSQNEEWFGNHDYYITSSFTYFIEDNLAISTGLNVFLYRRNKKSNYNYENNSFSLRLRLNYYFDRHLI